MTDWEDVKVKRVLLDYNSEDQLNKILELQDDNFVISDIQMLVYNGYYSAWIFYSGTYPDKSKFAPKPEPKPKLPFSKSELGPTHGTLPAGMEKK